MYHRCQTSALLRVYEPVKIYLYLLVYTTIKSKNVRALAANPVHGKILAQQACIPNRYFNKIFFIVPSCLKNCDNVII